MQIDFCNVQGLRSNFSEVRAHIELAKPDIFFLTETQIARSTPDLSAPNGYRLVHSFAKKHGVCAYIHPQISYARAVKHEINNKHFNSLALRLTFGGKYVFVLAIYRSPNTPPIVDSFEQLSDSLCAIFGDHPDAQVIVLGDFNVHHADWLKHSSHTDVPGRKAELFAASFGLQQLINEPTRIPRNNQFANTLDLVLSSLADSCSVSILPPLGSSDHCLISLTLEVSPNKLSPPRPRTVLQYSKADWVELENFYRSYPRRFITSCQNVNDAVDSLTCAIKLGIKLYIPEVQLRKPRERIFSTKVRDALKAKKAAYKKYNAIRAVSPPNAAELEKARQELRTATNSCKSITRTEDYLFYKKKTDKVLENPTNPREYYHIVRSLQTNFVKPPFPPFTHNGTVVSDPDDICNILVTHFAATSTSSCTNPPSTTLPTVACRMPQLILRKRLIQRYLTELNIHKATGPDGIPALILKRFASIFAPILTKIFLLALRTGQYPSAWKSANIQPIPKKGDKSDASNYRPIAIISVLSKIFEKYINWHILSYAEKHNLLNDNQYAFRECRSTCDALIKLTHEWNKILEQKSEAYAISLDLAKAFDTVCHRNLVSKLKSYGFDPELIILLSDFLSKRKITVVLDGHKSDTLELNAGVPQGSPLASTLFLFYINDLLSTTNNELVSYADDTTLFGKLPTPSSENSNSQVTNHKLLANSLTSDLNLVESWGAENLMTFNNSKTQLCVLSNKISNSFEPVLMNDQPLNTCESFRLLGVTVTKKLLWNEHVENIAKSTAQKLGFLARSRKFFNSAQCLKIYKSMIRPCLEYCSPVWGGVSESTLSTLDSIQKRAIKIINDPSVTNSLHSLQHRRDVADLSLFYRYYFGTCSTQLKSLLPPLLVRIRESRSSTKAHPYILEENTCRTTHFQNDFFSRTVHKWNKLPKSLFSSPSLCAFKTNVNKFLVDNPLPRLSSHQQ